MTNQLLVGGRSVAAILLLSALLAAGCVDSGSSGGSPADLAAALDGRTFLSTAVSGRQLVPGSRIRLAFAGGQLSANAGCNAMGGAFTLVDGLLTAKELMLTEMACQEPLMEQEAWFAALLGGVNVALSGDTLTLAANSGPAAGTTITLLDRRVADPDRPVEGTTWVLDGIGTGGTVSSVPAGVRASLRIEGGKLTAELGCNGAGGSATVDGGTIAFGEIASTKMACLDEGKTAVEAAMVKMLTGSVPYAIEATALTLGAPGGDQLFFRAEE